MQAFIQSYRGNMPVREQSGCLDFPRVARPDRTMNMAQKPHCILTSRPALQRAVGGPSPIGRKPFALSPSLTLSLPRLAVLVLAWYALVFNTMLIAAAFAAPAPAHWELCLAASDTSSTDGTPSPTQVHACAKHCLSGTASGAMPDRVQLEPAIFASAPAVFPYPAIALAGDKWSGIFARGPPESG